MLKDKIFFDKEGLTSTSANHICNLAKEFITNTETELNSVEFVDVSVGLIDSSDTQSIQEGVNDQYLLTIPEKLETITKAKSLIAWLREAIKARESLLSEVKRKSLVDFCDEQGLEFPTAPEREECLTEDEYLSNLSVKDRNRYFSLETKCAVIGKYIHPNGEFAIKRRALNDANVHKHKIVGNGRDAVIYTYTPSVLGVEDLFFKLQNEHREAQAELNGIKYKMEKAIQDDSIAKNAKYCEAYSAYTEERESLENKLRCWKEETSQNISSLKIIIPNDLKDIYNTISKIGK